MAPSPLTVYGSGLADEGIHRIDVRLSDGTSLPLALDRYLAPADPTDESLLGTAEGPVLDVGCGPGRHLHALARRGVFALGVDLSADAVGLARGRGGHAIVGSIFGELPGAGTWRTALLLDGNIGIGGAPERLLRRLGALLDRDGDVLVELDPPGTNSDALTACLETDAGRSTWFSWARVAAPEIEAVAGRAGFEVQNGWRAADRWFARLTRIA